MSSQHDVIISSGGNHENYSHCRLRVASDIYIHIALLGKLDELLGVSTVTFDHLKVTTSHCHLLYTQANVSGGP